MVLTGRPTCQHNFLENRNALDGGKKKTTTPPLPPPQRKALPCCLWVLCLLSRVPSRPGWELAVSNLQLLCCLLGSPPVCERGPSCSGVGSGDRDLRRKEDPLLTPGAALENYLLVLSTSSPERPILCHVLSLHGCSACHGD